MSFKLKNLSEFRLRNILIVDDEKAVHEMYTNVLRPLDEPPTELDADGEPVVTESADHFNFGVFNAHNGQEALGIAKAQEARHRPVQMAFVDMRMPGWDGIVTIGKLHELDPRMSFVIVTGFPADAHKELADRLGAMPIRVIGKPFELVEIYEAAYQLVARWNRLHGDF